MHRLLLLVFIFLLAVVVNAQDGWELKKEEDDIQVYVKKSDDSPLHAFRGSTVLPVPVGTIVAAITDVESFPQWMPNTSEVDILKTQDGIVSVYYLVADAPWPVKDRDGIYRFTYYQDADALKVTIGVRSLPGYLPEKEGRMRIRKSEGSWLLESLPGGKVSVTYELFTEPGGNVPAWLVNASMVDQPFQTLQALRDRVKMKRYQNTSYNFMPK